MNGPLTADISALIARVQTATKPSRELDGLIWCAINGYTPGYRTAPSWDGAGQIYTDNHGHLGHIPEREIKRFTSSIDVALTLLPENPGRLSAQWHPFSTWYVDFMEAKEKPEILTSHKFLACAIVIAALRMKESEIPPTPSSGA